MANKTAYTYTFSTSSGALATVKLNGGLYKLGIDATYGSSATMKLEMSFDGNYVDVYDIGGNAITDTSSSAVNKSYDFYVPAGATVRLNVTADSITSGNAYIAQVLPHNG